MKGYTIIEVMIAVLLLTMILIGGTNLFYQNLKTSGLSDSDLNLNTALRSSLMIFEKDIKYSTVTEVGAYSRLDCVASGENGVAGNTVTVSDLNGLSTSYSLDMEKIASVSTATNTKVYVSPSNIKITSLQFTWYCLGSTSDKMNVSIGASTLASSSGVTISRTVSADINLLNSGN